MNSPRQITMSNGAEVPEKPVTNADTLFLRGFSIRRPSGYNAVSTQTFMERMRDLSQVQAAYKSKKGEEKSLYREKNADKIELFNVMDSFSERIKEISKQIDKVYEDTGMGSQEKVDSIADFEDQILNIAREGNTVYNEKHDAKNTKL